MRPLSQIGIIRIPQNPNQRIHDPVPQKRTALDRLNDKEEAGYLHPTKGGRYVSAKRSKAALITAEMRAGYRWPMAKIKKELTA